MRTLSLLALSVVSITSSVFGSDVFSIEIGRIDERTIQVAITNQSHKKHRFDAFWKTPRWNFDIWIQDTQGTYLTSSEGECSDGNWYSDPPSVSFVQKRKKSSFPVLKPGETIYQKLELDRALDYLSIVPPNEPNSFWDRLSRENGPFVLKIRWSGIESNQIKLKEISSNQSSHTTPASAPR